MPLDNPIEQLKSKLHSETAKISWFELERLFAQGKILLVSADLDLVEVAAAFAADSADKVGAFINNQQISVPSNDQARDWHKREIMLWSVVVAPYVLVQNKELDNA